MYLKCPCVTSIMPTVWPLKVTSVLNFGEQRFDNGCNEKLRRSRFKKCFYFMLIVPLASNCSVTIINACLIFAKFHWRFDSFILHWSLYYYEQLSNFLILSIFIFITFVDKENIFFIKNALFKRIKISIHVQERKKEKENSQMLFKF